MTVFVAVLPILTANGKQRHLPALHPDPFGVEQMMSSDVIDEREGQLRRFGIQIAFSKERAATVLGMVQKARHQPAQHVPGVAGELEGTLVAADRGVLARL